MDRGARPPAPSSEETAFGWDRRRASRHRAHTPAYANLSGSAQGALLELYEVLNISEIGVCIQAPWQMDTDRLLPLALEFSATKSRVHIVGHVVWSEPTGKTGVRFPDMSAACRMQLREWIQANEGGVAPQPARDLPRAVSAKPSALQSKAGSASAYTSLVNEWYEIQHAIESCAPNLDPALQIIADRALTLTWASGAVVALVSKAHGNLICRARAGDAPEIGTHLDWTSSFSGECVRSGHAVICDDSELDPRVDRASCRILGIRSILACPIKRKDDIIGLIEVFSPEVAAFWENDVTILRRLANLVSQAVRRAEYYRVDVWGFEHHEPKRDHTVPVAEPAGKTPPPTVASAMPFHKQVLVFFAGIVCIVAVAWVLASWTANFSASSSDMSVTTAQAASNAATISGDTSYSAYATMNLSDVKKLARDGYAGAQYTLAMRFANGDGVAQDYHEARQWFLKAAESGHVGAQAKVAACFWAGRGGTQDYSKAYYWALLAQAGGDETSPAIVMSSAAHLSPAQTAAEQRQAEQWLHAHHIGHS